MIQWEISHDIQLSLDGLSPSLRRQIEEDLTLRNPAYDTAVRQGRSVYRLNEHIHLCQISGHKIILPRGYGRRLQELLLQHNIRWAIEDKRLSLESVKFRSNIELRPYQANAVNAMVEAKQGSRQQNDVKPTLRQFLEHKVSIF